jgi:hypothetical protein
VRLFGGPWRRAATLLALLAMQCQKPEQPTPIAPLVPAVTTSAAPNATGTAETASPPRMAYPLLHSGPKTAPAGIALKAKVDGCIEVFSLASLELSAGDHEKQKSSGGKIGTLCIRKGETVRVITGDRYWIAGTVEALEP